MEDVAADTSAIQPPDAPPDWAALQHEIHCPLCDYNLRGLAEPRCPECGHQFTWRELLTSDGSIHRYLFEHQPRKNLWSFARTFWATLFPWSFWKGLSPMHQLVLRRLMIFWLVLVGVLLLASTFELAGSMIEMSAQNSRIRPMVLRTFAISPSNLQTQNLIRRYGSMQAAVDAQYPVLTLASAPSFLIYALLNSYRIRMFLKPLLLVSILWPWLTLASLLIFRVSLAQARIKAGHVLRCVIYAQVPAIVFVSALLLGRAGEMFSFVYSMLWQYLPTFVWRNALLVLGSAGILLVSVCLWAAYRLYLRFPHAAVTVVASQIMVGLGMMKLWLMVQGY